MNSRGSTAFTRQLLAEHVFEFFAVFEIDGDVDIARHIRLAEIQLFEQGGKEFAWIELCGGGSLTRHDRVRGPVPHGLGEAGQFFPEKLSPIEDLSTSHVKQVY